MAEFRDVDALIVGGGASGLSLAAHLAAGGWSGRRVVVVEPDPDRPRHWAYWSRGDGLLDPAGAPGADRFRIRAPGSDQLVHLSRYRYRTLSGDQLSGATDRLLATAPAFDRVRGTVVDLEPQTQGARVTISRPGPGGPAVETLTARWVFDSVGLGTVGVRPRPTPALQLVGLNVTCDHDAFDPTTPTLMDFRTDQSRGLAFVYVLATSRRSALVEYTRFVAGPSGPAGEHDQRRDMTAQVEEYLSDRLGITRHHVTGTESATIPLDARTPRRPRGPVTPIGVPAGMVKASTGYGFERITRHSAAITRSLVDHGHPHAAHAADRWYRALDARLLDVIDTEPGAALDVLTRLFAANPGDRVLSFLDQTVPLAEQLALYRTLPLGPFTRAVVHRMRRSAR